MKKVTVLMSTYNGEKYVREQLDSILNQAGVQIEIMVRDDGSTDSTVDILEEYSEKGELSYNCGENIGYGKSFLKLLSIAGKADYYAFCDQDDIWHEEKSLKAVGELERYSEKVPSLYFSNLIYVDENREVLGMKDYINIKNTIYSAFIRHRVAGCTMVFNERLFKLARYDFSEYENMIHHDAWIYRLCLSLGGNIYSDEKSYIYYRQHGGNVTGYRQGLVKRLSKELRNFTINKNARSMIAQFILDNYEPYLNVDHKKMLLQIVEYKDSFKNTFNLLKDKDFRSGVFAADSLVFIAVITRVF